MNPQEARESLRQYAHITDLMNIYSKLTDVIRFHTQGDSNSKESVLSDIESIASGIYHDITEFWIEPIYPKEEGTTYGSR